MRKRKVQKTAAAAAALVILSTTLVFLGGCAGGSTGPINVTSGIIAQQDKADNPVFDVPPGHPDRIVFISDNNDDGEEWIYSMNRYGKGVLSVADFEDIKMEDGTKITPSQKTDDYTFHFPTVSQDGYTVYYSADYFATTTELMSARITNVQHRLFYKYNGMNISEPRLSWDGSKVAFAGYTERSVTALKKPTDMSASSVADSQLYFYGGGWKIETGANGLQMVDAGDDCPDSTDANYSLDLKIASVKGRLGFTNHPMGKAICINVDDTNFLYMEVEDYQYGWEKDLSTSCDDDEDCGDYQCVSTSMCLDSSGDMTSTTCSDDGDCEDYYGDGSSCNSDQACIVEISGNSYLDLSWKWTQQTPAPVTVSTTVKDSVSSTGARSDKGYVFIHTFDFRTYDLFTMDSDGTDLVRHRATATADDPERFPCFSPLSSQYVYFTGGVIDTDYMDYEMPDSSTIYKLDISGGTVENVTSGTMDKNCSVNPSGTKIAFSRYNGSDFDIYLYDISTKTSSLLVNVCGPFTTDTCGDDEYPTFSPDGNRLAFQSDETGDYDIYTTDLTGSDVVNITDNRNFTDMYPSWTP